MTSNSDFKARVRERMAKTGERYAAARAMLIAQAPTTARGAVATLERSPGVPLLHDYERVGGVHAESAGMANLLRQAGVVAPHTGAPLSEAMTFGLGGGIGFMSFAFEYADHLPLLTVVLRSDPYPEAFVRRGLERTGATVTWHATGSARLAQGRLDAAIDAGRAALVEVDVARLPWYGATEELMGSGPVFVVACGRADGRYAIDDRAPSPFVLDTAELAAARAGFAKGRHALATVDGPSRDGDLAAAVLDAIRGTARGFHEAPYPGYASNFGLRGLDTWARRITDPKDPKGWPTLLAGDRAFATALVRMVEGIELEFTAPAGGRPLYADFLDEAADVTGRSALARAAGAWRVAADAWRAFARAALPEDEPTLDALRAVLDARLEHIDMLGREAAGPNRAGRAERERLIDVVRLADRRTSLLAELGELARVVVAAERAALDAVEDAVA